MNQRAQTESHFISAPDGLRLHARAFACEPLCVWVRAFGWVDGGGLGGCGDGTGKQDLPPSADPPADCAVV